MFENEGKDFYFLLFLKNCMKEEIHTQLNPFVPERTAVPPVFTAKILRIEEGDSFLDVGFGKGEHAIYASSLVGDGCSVGVDSEACNVEQANILKNRSAPPTNFIFCGNNSQEIIHIMDVYISNFFIENSEQAHSCQNFIFFQIFIFCRLLKLF